MNDILNLSQLFASQQWAAAGGVLAMMFVTLLTDRAKFFPTWNSPWRTFLGTACGALGMGLSQLKHGPGDLPMLVSLVLTTAPTLIAEFLVAIGKGKPGAPRVIGLTLALAFVLSGCATWTRQDTRTVVDIAKTFVEQVCSPDDPTLDACLAKLTAARKAGVGVKP